MQKLWNLVPYDRPGIRLLNGKYHRFWHCMVFFLVCFSHMQQKCSYEKQHCGFKQQILVVQTYGYGGARMGISSVGTRVAVVIRHLHKLGDGIPGHWAVLKPPMLLGVVLLHESVLKTSHFLRWPAKRTESEMRREIPTSGDVPKDKLSWDPSLSTWNKSNTDHTRLHHNITIALPYHYIPTALPLHYHYMS